MQKKYSIQDFLEVKAAGSPSFSPDGSKIAYLSTITGTTQVYLMSSDGTGSEQLTDFPDSIGFARFSPAEDKIIFGKSEGGNEQTQFFILDLALRARKQFEKGNLPHLSKEQLRSIDQTIGSRTAQARREYEERYMQGEEE